MKQWTEVKIFVQMWIVLFYNKTLFYRDKRNIYNIIISWFLTFPLTPTIFFRVYGEIIMSPDHRCWMCTYMYK